MKNAESKKRAQHGHDDHVPGLMKVMKSIFGCLQVLNVRIKWPIIWKDDRWLVDVRIFELWRWSFRTQWAWRGFFVKLDFLKLILSIILVLIIAYFVFIVITNVPHISFEALHDSVEKKIDGKLNIFTSGSWGFNIWNARLILYIDL